LTRCAVRDAGLRDGGLRFVVGRGRAIGQRRLRNLLIRDFDLQPDSHRWRQKRTVACGEYRETLTIGKSKRTERMPRPTMVYAILRRLRWGWTNVEGAAD